MNTTEVHSKENLPALR